MTEIKIETSVIQAIKEHAQSLNPIECCGYLGEKNGVISEIFKMTNIDNSPEHFSFDPKEQFQVLKDARKNEVNLVSVYHSHPETPARLSQEDIELLNDPNMVYIIVSLMADTPDVKAYQLEKKDGEIEINRIEITEVSTSKQ
jgi:proteasome lid subunit RPN8/RPN11